VAGRREQQKQERELRILEAAEGLFATRGYDATAMSEVAARADLAVGTLYNYFAGKPEILLAIVRRDTEEGLASAEKVLKAPPSDPVSAAQALVERAVRPFERHDKALWRQLLAAAMGERSLSTGVFASDGRLVALLTALLRDLEARGDLRRGVDVGRAAIAVYGVFLTWFMTWVMNDAIDLDAMRSELRRGIELVMTGFLEGARNEGVRP